MRAQVPRASRALLGWFPILQATILLTVAAIGPALAQPAPTTEPTESTEPAPTPEPTETPAPAPTPTASPDESCSTPADASDGPDGAPTSDACPEDTASGSGNAEPTEQVTPPTVEESAPALKDGAKGAARGSAADVSVSALDDFFQPARVTVVAGETVFWANDGANPHTVTADDGSFDSGTLASGEGFSLAPGTAGTIPYFCRFHGAPGGVGMSGVLVVQAASAPQAAEEAPAEAPGEEPVLAETGFGAVAFLLAGVGLLLLGTTYLWAARRRGFPEGGQ